MYYSNSWESNPSGDEHFNMLPDVQNVLDLSDDGFVVGFNFQQVFLFINEDRDYTFIVYGETPS